MSDPNPDLIATQAQATQVLQDLHASLADTTDPAALKTILIEIGEVTHRINVLSQLIFHAQTESITAAAQSVASATADVKAAIAQIDNINAFLTTMTTFLGLVDNVIDLAKGL